MGRAASLRARRALASVVVLMAGLLPVVAGPVARSANLSTACDFRVLPVDGGVEGVLAVLLPEPDPAPVRLSVEADGTILVAESGSPVACSGDEAPRVARTQRIRVVGTPGADDVTIDQSGPVALPPRMRVEVDLAVQEDPSVATVDTVRFIGGSGSDRVAFVDATHVALSSGPVQSVFDGVDAWVIATGEGADVVDAGALTGRSLSVDLGAGDDTFVASVGDDVVEGGAGRDLVSYAASPARMDGSGVLVLLALQGPGGAAQETGASGTDLLGGFEDVTGSRFADQLVGDGGSNRILGGDGNDRLDGAGGDDVVGGGAGDDIVRGGEGADRASFRDAIAGVTVDLAISTVQDTGAGRDTLLEVEGVDGSEYADVLLGTGESDMLYGYGGDDRLVGRGGADNIDGGSGRDTVDYSWCRLAVRVDLAGGQDGAGLAVARGLDYLFNIEDVIGSRLGDEIDGSAGPNRIRGGAGDDVIRGAGGDDRLSGGPGRDMLLGGPGLDRCLLGGGGGRIRGCES